MADLIDREKLLQEVNRIGGRPWSEWETAGVRGVIYRQESVDAEPVRHGRWVKHKEDVLIHWDCSACGIGFLDDVGLEKLKYCPHCGAKMDLKEESA